MTSEADRIQHFLLIYDRRKDQLMSHESFGEDADAAMTAYRAVKITHSTYFTGAAARVLQRVQELQPAR